MAYADSWHVRSRGRECAASQRPFVDGEVIVTALFPDPESSGYLRRDFCVEAWKERAEDDEKPFSFWKTTFAAPANNEAADAREKLSAEEILRRLVEEDEDHTENTRYILAVMLERQKILRETDNQRTSDGIIRVYENRKSGEVYIVKDPDIPLSEVEAVQDEVFILLENNGRTPAPEEPIVGEPVVEEPVVEEPVVEEPDVEGPDVEEPDVEEPDVEEPDVEEPDGEEPDVEPPVAPT